MARFVAQPTPYRSHRCTSLDSTQSFGELLVLSDISSSSEILSDSLLRPTTVTPEMQTIDVMYELPHLPSEVRSAMACEVSPSISRERYV